MSSDCRLLRGDRSKAFASADATTRAALSTRQVEEVPPIPKGEEKEEEEEEKKKVPPPFGKKKKKNRRKWLKQNRKLGSRCCRAAFLSPSSPSPSRKTITKIDYYKLIRDNTIYKKRRHASIIQSNPPAQSTQFVYLRLFFKEHRERDSANKAHTDSAQSQLSCGADSEDQLSVGRAHINGN